METRSDSIFHPSIYLISLCSSIPLPGSNLDQSPTFDLPAWGSTLYMIIYHFSSTSTPARFPMNVLMDPFQELPELDAEFDFFVSKIARTFSSPISSTSMPQFLSPFSMAPSITPTVKAGFALPAGKPNHTANPTSGTLMMDHPIKKEKPTKKKARQSFFVNRSGKVIRGKPCSVFECYNRAQSGGKCKAHGGGARCTVHGCTNSSQGGGFCRTHGGGKKCKIPGCEKGNQRAGYCHLHGAKTRCNVKGCTKSNGGTGKCLTHSLEKTV